MSLEMKASGTMENLIRGKKVNLEVPKGFSTNTFFIYFSISSPKNEV